MNPSKNDMEATGIDPKRCESRWIGWLVIGLALAGLGICLYLYSLHMALLMGEMKTGLLCGSDSGIGCHAVTSGSYNSMAGIPLASWGMLFFIMMALFGFGGAIFYKDSGWAFYRWAFIFALAGFLFDLYLAYLMIFKIKAVCWLCVLTYAVNFLLAGILALGMRQGPETRVPLFAIFPGTGGGQGADGYYRSVVKAMLGVCALLAVVVVLGGSHFISMSLTKNDRESLVKIMQSLSQQQPRIVEAGAGSVMGASDSKVLVIEFSDFRCPFCSQASKYIKLAAKDTQDIARFVFRHYPLDKRCNRRLSSDMHPGACLLAEAAACADEQNRFWEYHDMAFETRGSISMPVVMKIAADVGLDQGEFESCMDSGRGRRIVVDDIEAAVSAGIRSTPTLVINGRILRGVPKPWMLTDILRYAAKNFPLENGNKKTNIEY